MRQWTIDAFAGAPFKGNPACVLAPVDAWPDTGWMQSLAAENNQAETAFLLRTADPARFGLRWFTPTVEVSLCGHATLASTHAIFDELGLAAERVTFDTLSGPLIVARADAGYRMDFPAIPPTQIDPPAGLAEALGVELREVWAARFLVAIVDDEAAVRRATPDLAVLKTISAAATQERGNVGISALAAAGAGYDVVSRFFAPGSGIPEDPTTGGYHCVIAPLFAGKLGRPRLTYHQAHPGRGGDMICEVVRDRVLLEGRAVTVAESDLRV